MWGSILVKFILFIALVPGVLFSILPHETLTRQALVHGALFAVINYVAYRNIVPMIEKFEKNPNSKAVPPCPGNDGMYVHVCSGDCRLRTDKHDGYSGK
jgi:hypothetical protein